MGSLSIKLERYTGKSNKTGKDFTAYKLTLGDYETLLFPRSNMERNYLERVIDEGLLENDV